VPIFLIALSAVTVTVVLLGALRVKRWTPDDVTPTRLHPHTECIRGRILFVGRRADELVLDCVAGACHPAQCSLAPGTPFTLAVEPAGPIWFGDAVESMVARWAEDDTVVEFLVSAGPDGDRVDVRGNRARVRLEVRAHAGLA